MISRIIKDEVCVIYLSLRLRWITQTSALIILDDTQPHSIIVYCLTFMSCKVWNALEHHEYLKAAQLYLLAQNIVSSLHIDTGSSAPSKLLVSCIFILFMFLQ
jgi:hypothetical protein